MKSIIKFILISLLIISLKGQGFTNVGSAGANFLQIPAEPVGAALGNSYVAHVKGVEGLYWNPSAIAFSEGTEVILSTVDWIIDTRISFAGVTHSFDFGTIGLSVTALTMDDMEITTELNPNGTGQFFGAGSYAVGLSYATRIIDRFSFGATIKYVYEYIWETNGSAIAFDFGSVYITDFHNLRIGMRLANFGGSVTFAGDPIDNKAAEIQNSGATYVNDPRLERVSKEYSLPQTFNVGIAIDPLSTKNHRLTLLASAVDPSDNDTQIIFGTEYAFNDLVFLRGGYKSGYDEQDFSFGVGLKYDLAGIKTQFDYAYSAFGILGGINFISLKVGI